MTSPLDLGELEPWEVGAERICEAMLSRAPIAIRRAAENLYEALMFDVQDYLRENVHYNLSAELAMAKRNEADAKAERDALIEEVKRLREGWQPIETAPKDGTWVTLLDDAAYGSNRETTRQWRLWQCGSSDPIFEEHWVDENGCICRSASYTHWMPLPAPPAGGSE